MAPGNEITLRKYEDFLLGKVAFSIKGPSDIEKEPEGDDADIEEAKAERKRRIAESKKKHSLLFVTPLRNYWNGLRKMLWTL